MMLKRFLDKLVEAHGRPASPGRKIVALLLGGLAFVVLVPAALYLAGYALAVFVLPEWSKSIRTVLSAVCVVLGLSGLAWSALTFVISGQGTPVPTVTTQKLVVTGPFRLCRNPFLLAASLYYLGLGVAFGSVKIGLLMFLIALVLGSCYNKFIEEKELLRAFGQEYEDYRHRTPFLIPKLWY